MNWRLMCCLVATPALGPLTGAQVVPGNIIQAPAIVVTEAPPPSDASGVTCVALQPEATSPLGSWEALSREVANVHVSGGGEGGFGSLFAMRGLSNTPYFSEPAITIYLADIPLPGSFSYSPIPFGLASVAVLRGPQGTTFGRATDGGVVVFSPNTPTDSGGGDVHLGYGDFNAREIAAEAHTAETGWADAEADVSYDARNGYIRNHELGIRVDDQENESAFARIRIRPASGDELTAEIFANRSRNGAQPLVPLGGPLFDVSRAQEGVSDLDSLGAAIKGGFALPSGGTLTSVTSFTDWRMNPYENFLVLPPPLQSQIVQYQRVWNEELRVQTDPRASVRATAGAWLSSGTTDNRVDRSIPNLFPVEVSGFTQRSRSAAAFADLTIALERTLRITAGLRAEADEKHFSREEQVPTPGLGYVGNARYGGVLPKLEANWDLGANSHAAMAVAFGLRPGGFASYTDNPALIAFGSERSTQYSVGFDASTPEHAVDIAVRAYVDAIGNYQVERSFTASDYFVATAPRAHAMGAELEGRWHPSTALTLGAAAGWTEARLDAFRSPLNGRDESGSPAPGVPRYNGSIALTYRSKRGWFSSGQLTAVGKTFYDELATPKYTQDAYALVALRAGYDAARWSVSIFGENLANKGYYELIIPGVNSANPGAPRRFGTETVIRF